MSTRQRSASTSRPDAYGLWRPTDSDSDRPRQTMATSQRHNVDQPAAADGSRKHRSSRRADPSDPSAAYSHHKSSSKDRASRAMQSSYYTVPQPPHTSSHSRAHDTYSDAYALRAYLKKKTDKHSPRSSNERVPPPDDAQATRSAYPSRYDNATTAAYAQPPAATGYYTVPTDHTTRDPTSSSRHHREREKDREKSSRRDAEKVRARDYAVEKSEDREKRRRKEKEAAKEKERSSKDREKRKEKERSKYRDAAADSRPADTVSLQQAVPQASTPAQRSTDRLPAGHSDAGRTQQSQVAHAAYIPTPTAPWAGLTASGRAPSIRAPTLANEAGYPSASDKEDPPLPIPPPGHRRERSSSKTHRSQRHQALVQHAAQDSGISSSEQEPSGIEPSRTAERRYVSREQASTLGRGQSSGPSGSENERVPTIQKERRKHRTRGESSRQQSQTAAVDPQQPPGPTTSQEIAMTWYQQHHRETSATRQAGPPSDSPQRPSTSETHDAPPSSSSAPHIGKPTAHVGLTSSHRPMPQIVSIRAGQGPSEPHAGTAVPKANSAASMHRQADLQPAERVYDTASRPQLGSQYYQQTVTRQQDALLQATSGQTYSSTPAYADPSRAYQHSSANGGVAGVYQQPAQGHPNSRHADLSGVTSAAIHAGQQAGLPDVVVRPPSAAPTHHDPYSSRGPSHQPGVVPGPPGGRLQVPSHDSRSRSTPAPPQPSHAQSSPHHRELDPYRSGTAVAQQHAVSDNHHTVAPPGGTHARGASQDPSTRFPVHEDSSGVPPGYGSQYTAVAYNPPVQASASRAATTTTQGQPSTSPKRNSTYPGASAPAPPLSAHVNPTNYHGAGGYDPRSPKPPSVATITPDAAGPRPHGTHGRESSGKSVQHQHSPHREPSGAQLAADAGYLQTSGAATGHSPSRPYLADPGRSPAVGYAVSTGSAGTPKHSPSGRLHSHRNGSNDTITHAPSTKPSPSSASQQQLPHRNSVINLQSNAALRPDNASVSRQPIASSGYPEPARYRSPAPPGYPTAQPLASNGAATSHSQSYSTQTHTVTHDYQYGRTAAPAQTTQHSHGHSRTNYSTDYGSRSQDPPHSAPPTSTSMPIPGQRVPPRSAASPAPTVRPARLTTVSSPTGKAPAPLHPAPPQPTRHQTYPAPAPNPASAQAPPSHSRTASDPQYAGRVGNSAYPSGSLPSRGYAPPRAAAPSATLQQPDVLLTPSSLAPSMLPQVAPTVPLGRTTSKTSSIKDKEKDPKKKGFFGLSLFRSRSSPPKPRDVNEPPPSAAIREKRQRNVSQPSQPAAHMQASHVAVKPPTGGSAPQVAMAAAVSIPTPAPQQTQQPQYPQQYPQQPQRGNSAGQVPLAAPTPIPAAGRGSPSGKMFTPFRLLSKRHRTVSTASVDAVDGTVLNAMLTGGDSTRSSTAGRPSPPLRDPMTAAQEWRNREEYEQQTRGTLRRRRPGVTFEVNEEVPEDGRTPVQKSMKANMASMQSTVVPVPSRQATA